MRRPHPPDRVEVWAPRASVVELLVGDSARKLERDDRGWFASEPLPFGTDYLVRVDGERVAPTPARGGSPRVSTDRRGCGTPRASRGPTVIGAASIFPDR